MSFDVHQSKREPVNPAKLFSLSRWERVLKLLGLIIVVDKKTFKEDVDTFLEAVIELRDIIDPAISMTGCDAENTLIKKPVCIGMSAASFNIISNIYSRRTAASLKTRLHLSFITMG